MLKYFVDGSNMAIYIYNLLPLSNRSFLPLGLRGVVKQHECKSTRVLSTILAPLNG